MAIKLICDGCGVEALTTHVKMGVVVLPVGWRSLRWTPGLVVPPGAETRRAGRYDFCTPACFARVFPTVVKEVAPE